jgi:antitoxin MazE
MKTTVRKIGNSRGVLIPRPILAEVGLEAGEAELSVIGDTIVLRPIRKHARAGWAEASRALAAGGESGLEWPEFVNAGDADLKW